MLSTYTRIFAPGFTRREDFEHGSAAAAIAGITTLFDMPLQNDPVPSTPALLQYKQQQLAGKSFIDYSLWGAVLNDDLGQLQALIDCGVAALKVFLSPVGPDYATMDLGQMRHIMQNLRHGGMRIGFHCEDYSIINQLETHFIAENRTGRRDFLDSRPLSAELSATYGVLALAQELSCPVHICHVSHPQVAELIRQAQKAGVDVSAETCPHYLIFSEEDLIEKGGLFKCSPPLRAADMCGRLWEYLLDGTLSCIGSDHSPCEPYEKDESSQSFFDIWGGISGIQYLPQLVYDQAVNRHDLSPSLVAALLAENPARVMGVADRKGRIEVGLDADIFVLDTQKEWHINPEDCLYKNKISALFGQSGTGLPVLTMLRGKIIAQNQRVVGEKGYGELLLRRNGND